MSLLYVCKPIVLNKITTHIKQMQDEPWDMPPFWKIIINRHVFKSLGGAVAQRVERWTCDHQVVGSNHTRGKAA